MIFETFFCLFKGSWFRSSLCERIGERIAVRDAEATIGNTLIWPAKFHLNGLSLHSRKKENAGNMKTEKKISRNKQGMHTLRDK